MELEQLFKRYKPLLRQNILPLSLGFLGLIFLGFGLITLLFPSPAKDLTPAEPSITPAVVISKIVIDVEGAVVKPYVYHLDKNSRIQDALIAAGGLSEDADRVWVAKNMNLALVLKDGMKVYIPNKSQNSPPAGGLKTQNYEGESLASSLININTANVSELDSLMGVGQATAQKIIDSRPYQSIEELVSKKVLGSKAFEKIKEKISVY